MNDSPANSSPGTAAEAWKQRYEALRQLAVTGKRILGADPQDNGQRDEGGCGSSHGAQIY